MSRVGKMPIQIPDKVKVDLKGGDCVVAGPLGTLKMLIDPYVEVAVVDGKIVLKEKNASPESGPSVSNARHGLMRNLIRNMVEGVSKGFKRELEINGVGYKAEVKGNILLLNLGFSHSIEFPIPTGIKIVVDKLVRLAISGASKDLVGEVAARIRKLKKPEPYKGKGIKYVEEVIIRKVGKSAATGGGK